MTDPQQELFTQLKLDLEAIKHSVYDTGLPPEGTPYPFDYLGDNQLTDEGNKSAMHGHVRQTIHVWHNNPRHRGTVSKMLLEIKDVCRKIRKTANFSWQVRGISQTIMPDNTTKSPLLHGVLYVDFYFN